MLLARFLVLDRCKSWIDGRLVPIILSADLIVRCSLCLSCLVADPNQTVTEVLGTDWITT